MGLYTEITGLKYALNCAYVSNLAYNLDMEIKMNHNLVTRPILSVVAFGGYEFAEKVFTNSAAIVAGDLSTSQLQDVNQPVVQSLTQTASGAHLSGLLLLGALGAIWFSPLKKMAANVIPGIGAVAAGGVFLAAAAAVTAPKPARAYFDTVNNPEFVEIQANQTAFVIPETGANKTNQAAFMSEQYLQDNKVAQKRIEIHHASFQNASSFGGLVAGTTYYIPSEKLYLIDRTPYMREWNDDKDRGTSSKKEGFRVESGDSVNIDFGVVISASVKEEDAAKFVYNFGAKPVAGFNVDPKVTFASVVYARSLEEVMDTNVRGEVQALLAREFGNRTTDECIHQKGPIMKAVNDDVKADFLKKGITIDYVGFATALNFETQGIQDAIDNTFISQKQAQAAASIKDALPTLQAQANIEVTKSVGKFLEKWNGAAPAWPSWVVVPSDIGKTVSDFARNVMSSQSPRPAAAMP